MRYDLVNQYFATVARWASDVHKLPVRPDALAWRAGAYKRKPPVPLLTDAQVEAIRGKAQSLGLRAYAVVDYLLTYGARPITACRLTMADLDLDRGELVVTDAKHSGGWRHAVEGRHIKAWPLATYKGDPAAVPLFPRVGEDRPWRVKNGSAGELSSWYAIWIGRPLKLGQQAGIYALKRHAITSMLRKGIDVATIISFTGHLDAAQVLGYAKTNAETQRAALAKVDAPRFAQAVTQLPKKHAETWEFPGFSE